MKFEGAGESVVEMLLSDDWVAEQKMDGTRGLIRLTKEGVDWNGLAHTAATQWVSKIEKGLAGIPLQEGDSIWLDGEIMIENGEFRVFDLPYAHISGVRVVSLDTPFRGRRVMLEIVALLFEEPVSLVGQAQGEEEKAELLRRAEKAGAEGVVFKHLNFGYSPGIRVKHQLKHQFIKRADVVVMERKPTSATVGVYRDGELVKMGGCSMIGKEDARPGEVVEMMFLYLTGAGVLYQPRMVRIREDKAPQECTFDQFRSYTREAV